MCQCAVQCDCHDAYLLPLLGCALVNVVNMVIVTMLASCHSQLCRVVSCTRYWWVYIDCKVNIHIATLNYGPFLNV